jgi:catechol 2,3-dioxygenase-like lactoylglutathione lyase family enzyme
MSLHRLLGMRLAVPDAEALAAYYDELGLTSDGGGSFAGTDGGPQIHVEQHRYRRLLEVRVGADDEAGVAATAGRLRARGLTPRMADGRLQIVDPVTEVVFTVEVAPRYEPPALPPAPLDNRPGFVARRNARAAGALAAARAPRRLGHLVIGTPDLAATRDLLVDGLGFKVSDQMEGVIAFLRCSTDHHNVGLVGSPVPLLQHYSWECDDVDHVGHTATKMLRSDQSRQAWGFGRHFLGSNYYWYLNDPAGSFLELYSDLDVIDDDDTWDADGRTTFTFEQVANSWGPDLPIEFIVPRDLEPLQAAWAADH